MESDDQWAFEGVVQAGSEIRLMYRCVANPRYGTYTPIPIPLGGIEGLDDLRAMAEDPDVDIGVDWEHLIICSPKRGWKVLQRFADVNLAIKEAKVFHDGE